MVSRTQGDERYVMVGRRWEGELERVVKSVYDGSINNTMFVVTIHESNEARGFRHIVLM